MDEVCGNFLPSQIASVRLWEVTENHGGDEDGLLSEKKQVWVNNVLFSISSTINRGTSDLHVSDEVKYGVKWTKCVCCFALLCFCCFCLVFSQLVSCSLSVPIRVKMIWFDLIWFDQQRFACCRFKVRSGLLSVPIRVKMIWYQQNSIFGSLVVGSRFGLVYCRFPYE